MTGPADFESILASIARELAARDFTYMVIGGQAVLLHGEPRLTRDIDLTLAAAPDRLPELLEACDSLGLTPLPDDVTEFVRRTFVLPAVDPDAGVRIDFIFSTSPFERQAIARAESVELRGTDVAFATAEDLILHKLFAGRPRDMEDVRGIVRRRASHLDWPYIDRWAAEFARVEGRENLSAIVDHLRSEAGP